MLCDFELYIPCLKKTRYKTKFYIIASNFSINWMDVTQH